jgi:hypothetical protein
MSTTELLIILSSVIIAYLWTNVLPFIWYIKTFLGMDKLKPLDCCVCLSTWIATILVAAYYNTFLIALATVCLTTFTAYVVERLIYRYL